MSLFGNNDKSGGGLFGGSYDRNAGYGRMRDRAQGTADSARSANESFLQQRQAANDEYVGRLTDVQKENLKHGW